MTVLRCRHLEARPPLDAYRRDTRGFSRLPYSEINRLAVAIT